MTSALVCGVMVLIVTVVTGDDVIRPPSILQGPERVIIFRRDEAVNLTCVATGRPDTITYTWTKDAKQYSLGQSNIAASAINGSFSIMSASSSDQGYYQCTANNGHGSAISDVGHLVMAAFDRGQQEPQQQRTVQEGQPLVLRCAPPRVSLPNATYRWTQTSERADHLQVPLDLSERLAMDTSTGNLYFVYTTRADHDRGFKCNIKNAFLDNEAGSSTYKVSLAGAALTVTPPRVMYSSPSPVIAFRGHNVYLRCIMSGLYAGKPPSISWRTSTGALLDPARSEEQVHRTTLLIREVKVEDSGEYVCSGSGDPASPAATATIALVVKVLPTFTSLLSRPHDMNVTEGDTVSIACEPEADPPASVQWYINGAAFSPGSNPRFRVESKGRKLTLTNVCKTCVGRPSDLMTIQCNASNEYGYTFAAGYLNVLERTRFVTKPPHAVKLPDAEPLVLNCSAVSDASTTVNVTWSKGGHLLVDEVNQTSVMPPGTLTLYGDLADTPNKMAALTGEYTCTATNGVSKVEATVHVQLVDVEEGLKAADVWLMLVVLAIILGFIILIIVLIWTCCCLYKRYRGSAYFVDKSEIKSGNDPVAEVKKNAYQPYMRPAEDNEYMTARREAERAMLPLRHLNFGESSNSLNDYAEIDAGRFADDGSFNGAYVNRPAYTHRPAAFSGGAGVYQNA